MLALESPRPSEGMRMRRTEKGRVWCPIERRCNSNVVVMISHIVSYSMSDRVVLASN